MVNVIGVRFENAGKLYFFDPDTLWPTPGDFVVVETTRGIEFGEVVTRIKEIDDAKLNSPLKKVVRIASEEDVQHYKDNKAAEKEAYAICQRKISEHKLDMKLVSVEYTFDNSKILFYFTANGRVDFRSLVKDLAGVFKTRIELRQIGVRDEAKMLGGLGPCGRPICCGAFLGDFQPVSIKMAKEQNLSLNPNKISGVCGRLMCCLKYEQDHYEATRKRMPKVGKEVVTPDGNGVVWDLNIIKETVRVRIQKGDSSELRDYPMDDVQRVGQQPIQRVTREETEAEDDDRIDTRESLSFEAASAEPAEQPQEHKPAREEGEKQPRERRDRRGSRDDRRRKSESGEKADKAEKAVKPAEKPVAPAAEAPAAPAPEKPAVSSWKAALAKAMAEAEGKTE
ncbi:MAG: stage 0 sporulation family protein [Clostridia bacterium]|nr:stage 0 sporulation family protein [Clostridia bacterium]